MPKPSDYIKKGWCQGVSARDEQGIVTSPSDPTAVAWCLTGSIFAAYPTDMEKRGEVYQKLYSLPLFEKQELPTWNDSPHCTAKAVIKVLEQIGE